MEELQNNGKSISKTLIIDVHIFSGAFFHERGHSKMNAPTVELATQRPPNVSAILLENAKQLVDNMSYVDTRLCDLNTDYDMI